MKVSNYVDQNSLQETIHMLLMDFVIWCYYYFLLVFIYFSIFGKKGEERTEEY